MEFALEFFVLNRKVSGQLGQTTTEDLVIAQNELGVGHEFVETLLQINRNIISSYIEIVTSQLMDSFLDTYSEIQIIAEFVEAKKVFLKFLTWFVLN